MTRPVTEWVGKADTTAVFPIRCATCDQVFDRGYRISAARASRPNYCSSECWAKALKLRAKTRISKRFWSKVQKKGPDECWPWMGGLNPLGYGIFMGSRGSTQLAHRWSYMLATQDFSLQPEIFVCHSCDNPQCVNPAHLWLGDARDNVLDMLAKGRQRPGILRGEQSKKSDLTEKDIKSIRASSASHANLAREYGVSATAIAAIRSRKTWKHVT